MLDKPSGYASLDYDVPISRPRRVPKRPCAKALYDNIADSSDELAFKKGDILTVIEEDTEGLKGWWMCSLRGRTGLCPGNRLRLLNSYDSGCFSLSPPSSPCTSLAASTATLNSSICSAEIYENAAIISDSSGNISTSQTYLNQPNTLPSQQQLMQQQRQGTRRSWHVSPNKVITPQRHGDVYIYNCPATPVYPVYPHLHQQHQSRRHQQVYGNQNIYQNLPMMSAPNGSNDFETYDTPRSVTSANYDCPRNVVCCTPTSAGSGRFEGMPLAWKGANCSAAPIQEESYDVPRPVNSLLQYHSAMSPSSSNSSMRTSESMSLSVSSSNRSSLSNIPADYDVPRRNPLPVRAVYQLATQQSNQQRQLVNGNSMTYDFPIPSTQTTPGQEKPASSIIGASTTKELPLELSSALETLGKLQSEATMAITRLLSFVSPHWRLPDKLEPVLMEVKLAAVRLRSALHDLTEFGEGALGNATRSEDRSLALKLRPLVRALRDADKLIRESSEALDAQGGWTIESLAHSDDKYKTPGRPPDSLDQLIACVQTLTEDVRQSASFIQGNAPLLFKSDISESLEQANNAVVVSESNGNDEWLEDYDYVSLESKDAAAKKNSVLREAIQANLKKNFDTVIKAAETPTMVSLNAGTATVNHTELTNKDKQLVRYYAVQISTHMGNLRQAIDSFLETVEKNQPPKFFIAYGKFVVVSAHNLVTIGDIVHRNVSKVELRDKILRCTDELSDALKTCVNKSKKAAAHFPSVTAVQEMVDSVVDISHLASALKKAMLQAVQQTI